MVIAVQPEFHRGFFELQSSGDEGRIVQELRLATLEWCVSAPLSDAGHDASGAWTAREFCLVAQWQSLRFVRGRRVNGGTVQRASLDVGFWQTTLVVELAS